MALLALGVSYQSADIDIRERFAFESTAAIQAARQLVATGIASEAVILSTCNRTEIYAAGCEERQIQALHDFMIGRSGLNQALAERYLYTHLDTAAVVHLMRVASGLDSMVLGEAEILGQLKQAYLGAANAGTVAKYLGRLFQTTFALAKEARTQTGVGVNPVSIAYAAAKLSQHIFSDLSNVSVLLIGAGKLMRLMSRHLRALGLRKIHIANRTLLHAEHLAAQFQGRAFGLEKIPELLVDTDLLISGTSAALPIVRKDMVMQALAQRRAKTLCMIDLSVPRNIEPELSVLENVSLYCIDDLETMVEENRRFRRDAAGSAEYMIRSAAERFMDWMHAQDAFRTLTVFRQKFEQIRDQITQENLRRLRLGENPEQVLKRLAQDLTNRFLHEPTCRLRTAGLEQEHVILDLMKELFELKNETLHTK